jgi:chromosome condensin MukBEF MukE localization factor
MSTNEIHERLQHMRDKAKELKESAERASDPQERKRLQEKSRSLESRTEQESAMRSGDIYPME